MKNKNMNIVFFFIFNFSITGMAEHSIQYHQVIDNVTETVSAQIGLKEVKIELSYKEVCFTTLERECFPIDSVGSIYGGACVNIFFTQKNKVKNLILCESFINFNLENDWIDQTDYYILTK